MMASVTFYFPTKAAASFIFRPSVNPQVGEKRTVDYPQQLLAKSAGGALYIQDKGVAERKINIEFKLIPRADYDAFAAFFNLVRKSLNTFEYEDTEGRVYLARWMNEFDFAEDANIENRYTGKIEMRLEN